jgi:hypothetical protein
VLDRSHTARGDDRDTGRPRDGARAVEVRTLLRPVAPDVGVDDGCHAPGRRGARQRGGVDAAALQPSGDLRDAVARVDADGHATGEHTAEHRPARGLPHSDRPQHDARRARLDHRLDGRRVAHPAAHLHRDADRRTDRRDQRRLDRTAGTRTVEIDDVEPARAQRLPAARDAHRIVAVDGLAREVALGEAHAATAAQVDGRVDDHPRAAMVRTKPRSRPSPTRWLFSGWKTPA